MVGLPEPEVWASVTVLPDTGLLWASFNVTVIVEVVDPSAVTDEGEGATVDCAAVTAPAVNVTVAVAVMVTLSVVSVAVNTSAAAVVDLTVKVAWPEASLVPWVVVMVGVPEPEVLASVTVLPETGLLLPSFNVTVIVEVVEPSAVTEEGEAATVEFPASAKTGTEDSTTVIAFSAPQVPADWFVKIIWPAELGVILVHPANMLVLVSALGRVTALGLELLPPTNVMVCVPFALKSPRLEPYISTV
jgi:hypothetical protein